MLSAFSIKNKLLVVYVSITAVVLSSAIAIIMRIEITSSKEDIVKNLSVLAEIVAERSVASIVFQDIDSSNSNLRTLKSDEDVVFACIRTSDNQEFSEYFRKSDEIYSCGEYVAESTVLMQDKYVDIFKPVVLEGQVIGSVHIKSSLRKLTEKTLRVIIISLLIFAVLMLLAALVSRRLMSLVTDPITDLKVLAEDVTDNKDYSLRMNRESNDEIGVLIGAFNNMLDQIQERDKALLEEKDKAESSAKSAEIYASETRDVNKNLESEIQERTRIEEELQELNETLEDKVLERTSELKELNDKIGDIARSAGMAEVASGVLHNVGNVLNSVNVSASVLRDKIRKTKADSLSRVVEMLEANEGDLAEFIGNDERGKQVPRFLSLLSSQLATEKEELYKELDELSNNIDHIKNVISMQQSYAGSYGVREKIKLSDLAEDSLRINMQGIDRHGIKVVKDYGNSPLIYVDKHKALQVIINLISNARHALVDSAGEDKILNIIIREEDDVASIEVKDTGVGIAEEDIRHLFEYGFKKRRNGHGYGLHHSALVANELGGRISVNSEGLGKGASFKLIIPVEEQSER